MTDLTEFLRARLDEDHAVSEATLTEWLEEAAEATKYGHIDELPSHGWQEVPQASYRLVQRWNPERILAEIAVKRQIIADAEAVPAISMRHVLKLLTQPYASHPDFDPAWGGSLDD